MITSETDRLLGILERLPRVRLVVVGDLIADEFIYGRIERVSREAPVLILRYDATEILPGGAGNAANNAAALGAQVAVHGVVGQDGPGTRLIESLGARANVRSVICVPRFVTPVKTRILAGGVHSAKQQVVRIDREGSPITASVQQRVERHLSRALRRADAVIISDYGRGLVTPGMWARAVAGARLKRPPFVFVDSRYALSEFSGMTASTPNEPELEHLAGVTIQEDREVLERAGRKLLRRLKARALLVTRGSRGMALFQPGVPTDHIPIVGSDQIADVTGAGDTVIASFALAVAAGGTFGEAARIANHAGGLVVMKRGTATITAAELAASIRA